jgi:hypothetical protein
MPTISRSQAAQQPTPADVARRWAWIALLGGASIGFSLIFACATPFVALVTLAALNMDRRDAFIVTGAVWLANQAVGYGVLDYPRTFDSYAWGGGIGVAVLLPFWRHAPSANNSRAARSHRLDGHRLSVGVRRLRTGALCSLLLAFEWRHGVFVGHRRLHSASQCARLGRSYRPQARRCQRRAWNAPGVRIIHSSGRPRGRTRHILRAHLGRSRCPKVLSRSPYDADTLIAVATWANQRGDVAATLRYLTTLRLVRPDDRAIGAEIERRLRQAPAGR